MVFFAISHKYMYKCTDVYRYVNRHRKGPGDIHQIVSDLFMVGKVGKARCFIFFQTFTDVENFLLVLPPSAFET